MDEKMERVVELMQQYPGMPIEIMVDTDGISEHRYAWHNIDTVRICPWIEVNDVIFTDYDDYLDYMEETIESSDMSDDILPESSFEKRIVLFTCAA